MLMLFIIGAWIVANVGAALIFGGLRWRWNRRVVRGASGLLPFAEPYSVGEGDVAVLFVHGFNDVPFIWRRVADKMAACGMACRAMRLPGAGDTVGVGRLDDLRRTVRSEIEALAETHRHVFVVGHSLGGALSLDAVLSNDPVAQRVSGVVLIAPLIEISRVRCPIFSAYFYYRLVRLLCPCLRYLPSVFKETLAAEDDADFVYSRDRFIHVSWYDSVFALVERLRGVPDAPLGLPVLAFTAGKDCVVDSCATENWCRRHSIAVRRVENATHPIPLCCGWQEVVSEILEWIRKGGRQAR